MDTTNRLYRFTNRSGRVNHGIVTEHVNGGVNVIFDTFDISERVQLPTRYGFVSLAPNPFLPNRLSVTEVLPLTADVPWVDERVARVAQIVLRGEFDEWWQQHGADVRTELYKAYRKG